MKRFIFRIKKISDTEFRVVEADTQCGIRRMSPTKCKTKDAAKDLREKYKKMHILKTTSWKVVGDDFKLVS